MWKADRLDGEVRRGAPLLIAVDGTEVPAFAGETIAAALLAAGNRVMRRTPRRGAWRGLFCGMGACYECLVTVDGRPNVRACVTPVAAGMSVATRPR